LERRRWKVVESDWRHAKFIMAGEPLVEDRFLRRAWNNHASADNPQVTRC
jgi:hypothetical protein